METELILTIIKSYGIQTAMLIWFMFRTETILKNNTNAITELRIALVKKR
jgi:hypothetical protein